MLYWCNSCSLLRDRAEVLAYSLFYTNNIVVGLALFADTAVALQIVINAEEEEKEK